MASPNSAAVAVRVTSSRLTATTRIPAATRRRAISLPMPIAAPVTTADITICPPL